MKDSNPVRVGTRLQYINLLRIFATVSVIFIHVDSMFISSQNLQPCDVSCQIYDIIHRFCQFAVPIFILISGSLLLKPSRQVYYQDVFRKYIPRILRALLLFGFAMCMVESYMTRAAGDSYPGIFLKAVVNLLTGRSWTHMWYLYMLIGLYALTPLYKVFFSNTGKGEQHCLIGVLALICVVMPYFKNTGIIPLESYIILPVFLFLYPCGYYIDTYLKKSKTSLMVSLAVLILYVLYICYSVISGREEYSSYDIPTVMAAIAVFHIFSFYTATRNSLLDSMSRHCFCIYIVHAVLLNVFFKVLHVETVLNINPVVNVVVVVVVAFLLSYAVSMALHLVPYLRNKVL